MSDEYGRGGRPPRSRRPRFEDEDDDRAARRPGRGRFDGVDDQEEAPRPRSGRPSRGPARPKAKPARKPAPPGFFARLFGGADDRRRRRRSREDYDWDYAQEDGGDDDGRQGGGRYTRESWDDDGPAQRPARRQKQSLMDLCTPVLAYSSVLPRDAGGMHPTYAQFRQEVLASLQKIETEAPEFGIDREDAQDAVYALSLFLDEDVATSEWTGKLQWANEPLYAVKLQDPEGGINFFRKLDEMGDRRRAVKEIFLVCLAMGFRGKYAELEPSQQAAKLGEIRQRVLRSIHPTPLDNVEELFPEAYEPAEPLIDDVPPPPKWWITASFSLVAVVIIIYAVLLWAASNAPDEPARKLKEVKVSEVAR
jgi:type VI secretion system protein ImpK